MDASSPGFAASWDHLGRLARVLTDLFPEPAESRRVVSDAGLERVVVTVDFKEAGATRWWEILIALNDPSQLEDLLTSVLKDHPGNPELAEAISHGKAAVREVATVSPPGGTSAGQPHGLPPPPRTGSPAQPPKRPLIDRQGAVTRIRSALVDTTVRQDTCSLLLLGESGVGKTRLIHECIRQADELGMVVLLAPCLDRHAEPLLPLRYALAQHRGTTPVRDFLATGPPGLVDYAPFLESFLGLTGSVPLGGSNGQGVYDGLTQVLMGLAEPRGLCLVLEDITDADQDTLSFLEYLGLRVSRTPLVTVLTVKEELLDVAMTDRLDRWRVRGCVVESVPPFEADDLAQFMSVLRDGQPVAPALVDDVLKLTGGNPFFVEQVLSLVDDLDGSHVPLADVPPRVEAVLVRRLRRVPDESRHFLEAASVALEVTHTVDLVAHVAELDETTAAERLRRAVRDHYLKEDPLGRVAFSQQLLQQVLIEDMLPSRRTRLNVRAAEWLEAEELLASASHHYELAGRTDDMVRTALAGAEQAEQAGLYATAAELFSRAWASGDDEAIGLRLAGTYVMIGSWSEAEAVLDTLPADLGQSRVLRSDLYFVRGSFDSALRELRLAVQDPAVESTEALIRLSDINLYLGQLRRALELSTEALAGTEDPTDRSRCLGGIGGSRLHMGDVTGGEQAFLEGMAALPQRVEERDRFAYTMALHNLGMAREAHGDWTSAKGLHAEALGIRLEVSAAREVAHSRHALVRCDIALGDFDGARAKLAEARAAALALGEKLEQAKLTHTEARIELLTGGDVQRAIRLLEAARESFQALSVSFDVAHASFSLAEAHAAVGSGRRSLEEGATARAMMEQGEFGLLAWWFPDTAFSYRERIAAGFLAYAAGDAVGLPWEGKPPADVEKDRLPSLHATESRPAGSTSDDTALTVLVAEHLVASGRADAPGFLVRLAEAAPGIPGLGPSTAAAIDTFGHEHRAPASGGTTNGALMRALPIGWALPIDRVEERRRWAIELSRATHTAPEAVAAACIGAACAAWAVEAASPDMILDIARDEAAAAVKALRADARIIDMLLAVSAGSWTPDDAVDQMDPYETITRALACMVTSPSMREAVLAAVRLGGDTDTVAALVGGVMGCGRGKDEVRRQLDWLDAVHLPPEGTIDRLAKGLCALRVHETQG
ncbi:MAG: hypothetical protein K0R30_292 [Ornithinibacter sp.]|jgi:ADP-ribosylglycohydrolase/tetratricopeptide (TPR) repeat protein|nr:hypothetical protein [Ornithinibacter sp.]